MFERIGARVHLSQLVLDPGLLREQLAPVLAVQNGGASDQQIGHVIAVARACVSAARGSAVRRRPPKVEHLINSFVAGRDISVPIACTRGCEQICLQLVVLSV